VALLLAMLVDLMALLGAIAMAPPTGRHIGDLPNMSGSPTCKGC
jgi:hypothetical protein